jgi:uncharacterized OB-fold protein
VTPDQGVIVSFKCSRCGLAMFPRHTRCRRCRGTDFRELPLSEGSVVTHTRLTATRPGFAKEIRLAVVEFGDRVRILGQVDGGEVSTGVRVRVSWGKLSEREDGTVSTGFRFVPVE